MIKINGKTRPYVSPVFLLMPKVGAFTRSIIECLDVTYLQEKQKLRLHQKCNERVFQTYCGDMLSDKRKWPLTWRVTLQFKVDAKSLKGEMW